MRTCFTNFYETTLASVTASYGRLMLDSEGLLVFHSPSIKGADFKHVNRKPIFITLMLVVLLLGGCESIPVQEMSDARQAVRSAADAGAALYAPGIYGESLQLLDDASKFVDAGRFDLAGKVADRAKALAIKARKKSVERGTGVEYPSAN